MSCRRTRRTHTRRVHTHIRIRTVRDAPAPPPSERAITGGRPDPLPGPADLAAAALALAGPYVAVLLDDGADALPYPLALRELVDGPEHVVPEVRQEQPGVVDVLVAQLLLVCQPLEHDVDERRHLRRRRAVRPVLKPRVDDGRDRRDHDANMESISCQPEPDRPADGAGDWNASERGGSEVRV